MFKTLWFSGAADVRAAIPRERWTLLDPGFDRIAAAGEAVARSDYTRSVSARGEIGLAMARFHCEFDILLTPTLPLAAFEAGRLAPPGTQQTEWAEWTPFSFPFNLTQQPAASIPCGFTNSGLPIGLQIVGAPFAESTVLALAHAYEQATDWHRRSPSL